MKEEIDSHAKYFSKTLHENEQKLGTCKFGNRKNAAAFSLHTVGIGASCKSNKQSKSFTFKVSQG